MVARNPLEWEKAVFKSALGVGRECEAITYVSLWLFSVAVFRFLKTPDGGSNVNARLETAYAVVIPKSEVKSLKCCSIVVSKRQ